MGEARRKKLAGLMPVAEERTITLHRDGRAETDGGSGAALPGELMERFRSWAEQGERWDARYRTAYIGAGLPQERLETGEHLRAIPVPERLRLRLHLLSGPDAWRERELAAYPESFFGEGGAQRQLSLRATEYDVSGHWVALPEQEGEQTLKYLMQHPAVTAAPEGEVYTATLWHGGERDGELELQPDPPAELRPALEEAARALLAPEEADAEHSVDLWLDEHIERLGDAWMDDAVESAAPLARRTQLTVTPAPLVLSPTRLTLARATQGGAELDVVSRGQEGDAYTLDGQQWQDYPSLRARRDTLRELMAGQEAGLAELLTAAQEQDQPASPESPESPHDPSPTPAREA